MMYLHKADRVNSWDSPVWVIPYPGHTPKVPFPLGSQLVILKVLTPVEKHQCAWFHSQPTHCVIIPHWNDSTPLIGACQYVQGLIQRLTDFTGIWIKLI